MKKLFVMLIATTALAGCATTGPAPVAVAEIAPLEAPTPPPPVPAAKLGSFGFDQAGMDSTVLPGNNFYQYANGVWAKNTPIPADKANYGMFGLLDDLSKERTRTIVDEAAKDPASKIGTAYTTYLDTAAIEAKGLGPVQSWLDEIQALSNRAGYAALVAKAGRRGIGGPFGFYVGQDDKSPDRYVAQMGQSGIGMPDRDYYLSTDAKIVAARAQYLTHLTNVLTLAAQPNAAARAKAILDHETAIARAQWTRTESRDATKTYNLMPVARLAAMAPGFDFARYLADSGVTVSEVIVAQPTAFTGIARVVSRAPLQALKDQLMVRTLDGYASVLPVAFDKETFAFYGTALSGTPEQEVRWKRGVAFVTGSLADDVSQIYVERYYPPETKAKADELVRNVVAAMGRRIDGLTWMAPATKVRARAKLANFTTKIGYPDRWQDYSALEIRSGDALGNALRAAEWAHQATFPSSASRSADGSGE